MQLNEITPWFDGGLMYGPFKAWTDAIRAFRGGELAAENQDANLGDQLPQTNEELGLPYANPPPPFNNSLFPVNRFRSKYISPVYVVEVACMQGFAFWHNYTAKAISCSILWYLLKV